MSTWLYLNKNALWLMQGGTNQFISKRSYNGKVNVPSDWWLKRTSLPGQMVVMLDGPDPLPFVTSVKTSVGDPPGIGLQKYTKGKPFLYQNWTGEYDSYGFKSFLLQLINDGKVVDQLKVISGSPVAQRLELPRPEDDYSGSGNPIPEGIYQIGRIIRMGVPEKGVGYVKIPLDVLPDFDVNNRSELLFHSDFNRSQARGSLGCVVTYTEADMDKIVKWCEQKAKPEVLVVNYGKDLLKSRGVEVSLGKG